MHVVYLHLPEETTEILQVSGMFVLHLPTQAPAEYI